MNRWAGVARFGGVGDNLMSASPLKALKRMGYMTEVITSEPNHVLYQHNPYIDKLSVKNVERDLPQNDLYAWQKWFDSRCGPDHPASAGWQYTGVTASDRNRQSQRPVSARERRRPG